ncbi:hypothetical protein VTN77DRAFT_2274 [Rasamsonia byssochlamydoides]|uniref:uncharacterized protein n=1 Tax=Rasamsonia byssochlamydoides TaxID=89139 RepID=UPI0037422090
MSSPDNVKTVNYSKPQLAYQPSQHSGDYYSLSSSGSSNVTVVQYATPQSRIPSQPDSPQHSSSRTSLAESSHSSDKMNRRPAETQTSRRNTTSTVRFGENQVCQISPRLDTSDPRHDTNAPTPGVDDGPYIRFAIDQLTRDEEVTGVGRHGSVDSSDYPVERIIGDEGLGYYIRTGPTTVEIKKHQPKRQKSFEREKSVNADVFVAVEPNEGNYRYPSLDYVPVVLRVWALAIFIFLCLLMIAGVAFCNAWSQRHQGLWDYDGVGGSRYFIFQFLPQLLAILLVIWAFVIQAAVYRITPFCIMASERQINGVLQQLSILPRNFVLPDLSHFKHGEPLVGFALFSIWLSNLFAVPLQSCLFQTKHYDIDGQGTWRWVSVQPVGWTLVALYALLVVASFLLMLRFCSGWTGLMWDPVSLADLIPLIQKSNILRYFDRSETAPSVREALTPRVLRLGYWRLLDHEETFYGIGQEYAPGENPTDQSNSQEKRPVGSSSQPADEDLEHQGMLQNEAFERSLHSPFTRYRWTVWFLRDTFVLAWIVIILVLFVAFVVVSFVKDAIPRGFLTKLPTRASDGGFSPSNFVYSFIPAFIGTVLFLAWQPIDVYFRALQPFKSMSSPEGTSAEHSLLLSYNACLPIEVTILALLAGHYKVAWISYMSVVSLAIPVLSGGVFIALWYPSQGLVRISACLPAYYALAGFCALYALSFLVIWPRRQRYLPHDISTLADLISFLYQSPLLTDKALQQPRAKTDLVTRLVVTPPGEREAPVYGFGIYKGLDGRDHFGIDRLRRPGQADMLITTASMK